MRRAGSVEPALRRLVRSGRRDLNPRPSPWQGDALPLSHFRSRDGAHSQWGRRDLNSHGFLHVILSHARLPFRHFPRARRPLLADYSLRLGRRQDVTEPLGRATQAMPSALPTIADHLHLQNETHPDSAVAAWYARRGRMAMAQQHRPVEASAVFRWHSLCSTGLVSILRQSPRAAVK